MKLPILLFIATSFLYSCVSYDYYRFRDYDKVLLKDASNMKFARENILFKNQDIQITAKIEEKRLPSFSISADFETFRDSVLVKNLDVLIYEDTLTSFSRILVNKSSHGLYYDNFKDIPTELRLNPSETFYFGYANRPTKEEIGLKIFLDYTVGGRVFSDTILIEGLARIKTNKQFIPLH